jgi:hypothetical protein
MKLFLSGAHGSGCSLVKSLLTNIKVLANEGTCHESWKIASTQAHDYIYFDHVPDIDLIKQQWQSDQVIWLWLNPKNVEFVCRRIVYLDFVYANDPEWLAKDWAWTMSKHNRLAGSDWPAYSKNLQDYPLFVRQELYQTAYDRSADWMQSNPQADYFIDSDELFGNAPPRTLQTVADQLQCTIDLEFLTKWKTKNHAMYAEYKKLFE